MQNLKLKNNYNFSQNAILVIKNSKYFSFNATRIQQLRAFNNQLIN